MIAMIENAIHQKAPNPYEPGNDHVYSICAGLLESWSRDQTPLAWYSLENFQTAGQENSFYMRIKIFEISFSRWLTLMHTRSLVLLLLLSICVCPSFSLLTESLYLFYSYDSLFPFLFMSLSLSSFQLHTRAHTPTQTRRMLRFLHLIKKFIARHWTQFNAWAMMLTISDLKNRKNSLKQCFQSIF